jgi:hypothetical protein
VHALAETESLLLEWCLLWQHNLLVVVSFDKAESFASDGVDAKQALG